MSSEFVVSKGDGVLVRLRGASARDKTVFVGGVDAARARQAISSRLP